MQTTVKTSELLQHRVTLIPGYMETMRKAIKDRDYRTFAELTMKVILFLNSVKYIYIYDGYNTEVHEIQKYPM